MFDLRSFLMSGLTQSVGKEPDYKVIANAAGWFDKGVLLEEDLAELERLIGIKNTDAEKEDMKAALEELNVQDIPDEEVAE